MLSLAHSSGAQNPPLYQFGEVVVTGEQPRVVEEVTTTEVVTAEEIEASGARTLDEAIELLPGLFVRRGAEGVALIDVRGLRTRNVLLLLDGIPLSSSFDGLFDPQTLPLAHVAKIKLTRGASSVLYGPWGNAGVLDIVTRAADEGIDASARVEAGSASSSDVQGEAAWRRGDLGIVASAAFHHQDHFDLSDAFEPTSLEDGGHRLSSDREDRSAFATMTYDAAPNASWGLHLSYRGGERGKPPVTEDFRTSDFAPRPRFERADADSLSLQTGLSLTLGQSLSLRPTLFFNRTQELTNTFDDATFATQVAAGAAREDATASIYGAALQLALRQSSRGLLSIALDLRQEDWQADGFNVVQVGSGGGGGSGGGRGKGGAGAGGLVQVALDQDRSVRITSLAAEYELTPRGPFSAVLGVGYAAQGHRVSRDEDGFNFLVGGAYALGKKSRLRGSVARQIRFPTLRDLYESARGNPELAPEHTLDYELAFERALGASGSRFEAVLFRIDAKDFIQGTPGDILRNTERVRRQGVELSGLHHVAQRIHLRWSYTYLDATNRSPDADTRTIQNQPEHKVALSLERGPATGLRLRADALYVANNFALSRSRPTRTLELGDYTVLGLGISKALRADRYRLTARLENALDEDYVESIGFPAPGRTLFVGLALSRRR